MTETKTDLRENEMVSLKDLEDTDEPILSEEEVKELDEMAEEDWEDDVSKQDASSMEPDDVLTESYTAYIREASKYPILTKEEEEKLGRAAKEGDKSAREKLILHNLRLVIFVAKRYAVNGHELTDLIQEGNIGLMKAAERYDVDTGYRFTTYATWWIRQGIQRYASYDSAIRKPVHFTEKYYHLRKVEREMEKNGKKATPDDLAKALGISKAKVLEMIQQAESVASLDAKIGRNDEDPDAELKDFIKDDAKTPEEAALQNNLKEVVRDTMEKRLTKKEFDIISRRFGMNGYRQQTLEEVGNDYGVTRERVRQIESKAMRKLSSPRTARTLKELLNC